MTVDVGEAALNAVVDSQDTAIARADSGAFLFPALVGVVGLVIGGRIGIGLGQAGFNRHVVSIHF